MLITNPGSVAFWFDPQDNPFAFKSDNNIIWGQFTMNNERCLVISEGQTLSVIMNQNTDRQLTIFHKNINPDSSIRHMIAITWEPENFCLYFDGVLLEEIHPKDFK